MSGETATHPGWADAGRDAVAAAVVSLAAISFYLSTASLIFQGSLAPYLPAAIGAALLGGAVLALFAAARGSLPLASVGSEPATVPVLAAITAGVAAQASGPALLPTAIMALATTGLAIGLAWWWMGRSGGGDVIRYIPYPVIGGFIGSVGWLMCVGGLSVAAGHSLRLADLQVLSHGELNPRMFAGLGFGGLLWWAMLRFKHILILPGMLLLGCVAIHSGLLLAGVDLATARAQGWLLAPFSQTLPVWPGVPAMWAAVDWSLLLSEAGLIASAVIVATISLLLSDTSLEVAWEQRADLNQDLRVLGQANVVSVMLGGLVGGVSITRSILNRAAGAATRRSGVMKAAMCLVAMAGGGPLIALVPRPVLGGLLVYLGLGMLKAWVLDSRHRLPRRDHLTVVAMVLVTSIAGFLAAVCVGVLACCVDFAVSSGRLSPVRRLITRNAWPGKVERSSAESEHLRSVGDRLHIVELQGVLFFGSATRLGQQVEALIDGPAPIECLLFDFRHVRWLDSSAAQVIARLFKQAHRQGVRLEVSQLAPAVRAALQGAGALGAGGPTLRDDVDASVAAWDDAALAAAAGPAAASPATWPPALIGLDHAPALLERLETVHLAPGQRLFSQGEASDALYFVRDGRLVAVLEADGREQVVRAINAGGAIGEMGLFRAAPRSTTVRAEQASTVLRLRQSELETLEQLHPELAAGLYRLFLRQLSGRIDQLTAQVNVLSL